MQGRSGVPEVSSGISAPPISPLLATTDAYANSCKPRGGRAVGAVQTIAEDCERVFCETLKSTFLSEKDGGFQDSLAVGAPTCTKKSALHNDAAYVEEWVEVWDYTCDLSFRGFVAASKGDRAMFVFFEADVVPKELKPR